MNKKVRTVILVILLLVFLGSGARILYQLFQYQEGDKTYSEAAQLVDLPDFSDFPTLSLPETPDGSTSAQQDQEEVPVYVDPYADALRNMDFSALREVNGDVLGWILIPGSNISYPIVQGSDNSYYLNHTWKKTRNSVGAIFLECQNSRDLSDFNTIIYGHRMNNRSMFGTLSQYKSQSYWANHPYIYITDDNGSHKYEVFAAYEVSVEGSTYQLGFSSDQSKQAFLDFCMAQSVIDTGVVPTIYDRILTLSTCTGNGHATRWVVQGMLKGEVPPDPPAEEPPAVETPAPDESGTSSASSSAGSSSADSSSHSISPSEGTSSSGNTPGESSGDTSQSSASSQTPSASTGSAPDSSSQPGAAPGSSNSVGDEPAPGISENSASSPVPEADPNLQSPQ